MKRVTGTNYKRDTLYPRVERAVRELLADGRPVSAPAVFVKMGMLSNANLAAWRTGRVPYLERVIAGNLGKTSRVLRVLAHHARELKLSTAPPHAAGNIKWKGRPLRFSKTGAPHLEEAYKRVFSAPRQAATRVEGVKQAADEDAARMASASTWTASEARRDRLGYIAHPPLELRVWEWVAAWPDERVTLPSRRRPRRP